MFIYKLDKYFKMVKVQVDLNDEEDKIVDLFRAENRLKSKQRAIKEIIKTSKINSEHLELHHLNYDHNANNITKIHRKKDYIN